MGGRRRKKGKGKGGRKGRSKLPAAPSPLHIDRPEGAYRVGKDGRMVRDDREMIQFTGKRMVPIACGSDASAWAAIVGMTASAAGLCRMCRRRLGERARRDRGQLVFVALRARPLSF